MSNRRLVRLILTALPPVALLAGVALGQGEAPREPRAPRAQRYADLLVGHARLLDGRVHLAGPGAEPVGRVRDFTVNARSGRILSVAVELDREPTDQNRRPVVVPWTSLRYDPRPPGRWSLQLTAKMLTRMPRVAVPVSAPDRARAPVRSSGLLHARDLHHWRVLASDGVLGAPHALMLCPAQGEVAFVVVTVPARADGAVGQQPRLCALPWSVLSGPGDNGRNELRVHRTAAVLALAPRLERGDDLHRRRHRQRVYEFFGVAASRPASTARATDTR